MPSPRVLNTFSGWYNYVHLINLCIPAFFQVEKCFILNKVFQHELKWKQHNAFLRAAPPHSSSLQLLAGGFRPSAPPLGCTPLSLPHGPALTLDGCSAGQVRNQFSWKWTPNACPPPPKKKWLIFSFPCHMGKKTANKCSHLFAPASSPVLFKLWFYSPRETNLAL